MFDLGCAMELVGAFAIGIVMMLYGKSAMPVEAVARFVRQEGERGLDDLAKFFAVRGGGFTALSAALAAGRACPAAAHVHQAATTAYDAAMVKVRASLRVLVGGLGACVALIAVGAVITYTHGSGSGHHDTRSYAFIFAAPGALFLVMAGAVMRTRTLDLRGFRADLLPNVIELVVEKQFPTT
jgi:hypothetical protein